MDNNREKFEHGLGWLWECRKPLTEKELIDEWQAYSLMKIEEQRIEIEKGKMMLNKI